MLCCFGLHELGITYSALFVCFLMSQHYLRGRSAQMILQAPQGCRFYVIFRYIFGPIRKNTCMLIFSMFSYFIILFLNFLSFCLFLCSFSVRRHAHIDFQLFSQKSSGIPGTYTCIEVADEACYLTHLQYSDDGPTSSCRDHIAPSTWKGSHQSVSYLSHWYDSHR